MLTSSLQTWYGTYQFQSLVDDILFCAIIMGSYNVRHIYPIEGFHVTSQQPNRASQAIHSRHVGSFFAMSGIGKSHKICSHSLLLNLQEAKLYRSNNVINIYSLTASLTCSNKISKKLKHILLFFPGFSYTTPRKKISNMASARSAHGVRTAS